MRPAPNSGVLTVPWDRPANVDLVVTCSSLGALSGMIRLDHDDPCTGPIDVRLDVNCLEPEIFADGFESGNTTAWSGTVP